MRILIIIVSCILFSNIWAAQDSYKYFDKESKLKKWIKSGKNAEITELSNTLLNELNNELPYEQIFLAVKFYDDFTLTNSINLLDEDSLFQADIIQTLLNAESVEDERNNIFSIVRKFGSEKVNMFCLDSFQLMLAGSFSTNRFSFDQIATQHDCELMSNSVSRVTLVQTGNKVTLRGTAIFSLPKKIFIKKLGILRSVAIPVAVGQEINKLKEYTRKVIKDLVD